MSIGGLGFWEIVVILVVVLLLFGGKKIPQLARDLGTGIREFKKTMSGAEREITDVRAELEDTAPRPVAMLESQPAAPARAPRARAAASRAPAKKATRKTAGRKKA